MKTQPSDRDSGSIPTEESGRARGREESDCHRGQERLLVAVVRHGKRASGLTLVEVMVSLLLLAAFMVCFLSTFVQSRRMTESSVLNAACTSLVYGLIEQMKGLDYTTLMPSYDIDTAAPDDVENNPPYIRLRVHQDKTVWLRVVHTTSGTPLAPTTTPLPSATAASVGAIDNFIGAVPLSTVTGTTSQDLSLNLWIWVDEIPDATKDVSEVKKITVVYTYSYQDGGNTRTMREREVFLRTRYDQ